MTPSQAPSRSGIFQSGLQGAPAAPARAVPDDSMQRVSDNFVRVRFLCQSAAYLGLHPVRAVASATGMAIACVH